MQVNYDFHDDLTTVKVDDILAQYRNDPLSAPAKDVK